MQELKLQEKEGKQKLLESNKRKASEIRRAAMEGRASKLLILKYIVHGGIAPRAHLHTVVQIF